LIAWAVIGCFILGVGLIYYLVRLGRKAEKSYRIEADDDLRNKSRDARQRLDHDERERLRKKYGK